MATYIKTLKDRNGDLIAPRTRSTAVTMEDNTTTLEERASVLLGLTATTAELNTLDGITSTVTELNVLDGIPSTLTAIELGYVDGVTSAIQTQLNTKPTATTANITYYISSTGSDSNDGLSAGAPFLTMAKTLSMIPTTVNHSITISGSHSSVENMTLNRFNGSGTISFVAAGSLPTTDNLGDIYINNCSISISIRGYNIKYLSVNASQNVLINICNFDQSASSLIMIQGWSNCIISNSVISNCWYKAIQCQGGSRLQSSSNTGSGNATVLIADGGNILKIGTQPSGTTAESIINGGTISTDWRSDVVSLTNKTLTSPKINEDVILTSTATELNVLDGIPSTLTAIELGYLDGVTSSIQSQFDNIKPTGGSIIYMYKTLGGF